MDHRWVRTLGIFQIVGALMMFGLSLTPRVSATELHVNVPVVTWVFASVTFLAGVLLVGRHASGVTLSLVVQLAQVVSANAGWRYVFLAGPKLTWVIASVGTGLFMGGGGLLALTSAATDGTLNAVGLGADMNIALMPRPLSEASWAVGINLIALYFARRLWRLRTELSARPPVTATTTPSAV